MKKIDFIMDKIEQGYSVQKITDDIYTFTINNKKYSKDFFNTLYYNNKNEFRFRNVETKPK
jgi:hypothetical protein